MKRPYEQNPLEPNGRGKWLKASPSITLPNQLNVSLGAIVFRMLFPASKTGSVIGKGGSIVAKICQETGAKIRIEETVPGCEERVVVIAGSEKDIVASKEQNKEGNLENSNDDGGGDAKANNGNDEQKEDSSALEGSKSQTAMSSAQKALVLVFERIIEGEAENSGGNEENKKSLSLCAITSSLQPSRLSSQDDRVSPPQEAIFHVQERTVMAVPDKMESTVMLRLLVASNQTGCLLGKGGAIIAEMRKLSGAHIRVLGKAQVPKFVSENDEVVQVTGEPRSVHNALVHITTKLKHHFFRDKIPTSNHIASPTFVDHMPPILEGGNLHPGCIPMYPNFASSFQNYDSAGHPLDERHDFPIHSSGVPHVVDRILPAPWAPQLMIFVFDVGGHIWFNDEGMKESGSSLSFPDHVGGAGTQRRIKGFPGASQPTVITNITVDVVVPQALVPSICGDDGSCLKKIREISEARITITEPRPEVTETVIIISGTPEQTHAAQSLIHAFIMCGSGSLP